MEGQLEIMAHIDGRSGEDYGTLTVVLVEIMAHLWWVWWRLWNIDGESGGDYGSH